MTLDARASERLRQNNEAEVPARLRIPDEQGKVAERDVSLRIKGGDGSRRGLDEKPAFKVAFPKGERLFGLEGLTLNNMVQDHTMAHEALGYPVYDALGIVVPHAGFATVEVNGEPYGLYVNVETIDKSFLARRFGSADGILYEGAYGVDLRAADIGKFELHLGADPGRARLTALVQAVDAPGDGLFYGDHPLINLPTFLRMTATEGIVEDWDSYFRSNNYRIYWVPSASQWVFIPTGIDQTFVANETPVLGAAGLLFQKCLSSERCAREFQATVGDVLEQIEHMNLPARLDKILHLIGPASEADARKPYDADRMHGARDRLYGFLKRRPAEVRAALACVDEERAGVLGACSGVIVERTANECLEVVPPDADENAGQLGIAACTGTFNERWRVKPSGGGVRLSPVDQPDRCVRAMAESTTTAFAWAACDSAGALLALSNGSELHFDGSASSNWHIRRSIYE